MESLRIRGADPGQGLAREQYFGRLGEAEIGDRGLTDAAARLLAAIRLCQSLDRNPAVCLATNRELAHRCGGRTERWVTRHIAELIARGFIEVDRVRTIAGSPRGIRTLSRLRGAGRTQTGLSRCTPTELSMHLDTADGAPRQDRPGPWTAATPPLKREGTEEGKQQERGPAAGVVAPSSPTGDEDTAAPGRPDFLGSIVRDLADALAAPTAAGRPTRRGAKGSPGGPSTKTTPRGESRAPSVDGPDPDDTSHLGTPSSREDETKG